ncbi:exodeoxyribonuclease VII small subunit, partial [bacterium]|nr:exodeoxyribonuclease VII small subunit [bacterium]
ENKMSDKNLDYKKLSTELDEILDKLRSGDVDIDESITYYEKGNKIISDLEKYLKESENRFKKIS